MTTSLFPEYASAIKDARDDPSAPSLALASAGSLSVFYAPFDYVNPSARLVIVGISPGRSQSATALHEARTHLLSGATHLEALQRAKKTAAFSGAMRVHLTGMLDHIGLAKWLRISDCLSLFAENGHLLQTTSVLPFPVFVNGENYSGTPDLTGTPILRSQMVKHFLPVVRALPDAVILPLGPVPTKALAWLAGQGLVAQSRVLAGVPHPSPANAERISYFLGRKEASKLSPKTNAAKLDAALSGLRASVIALSA